MLNVLLLIAVVVLFYLHFSSKQEIADVKNTVKNDSVPKLTFDVPKNLSGAKVLYVNIDSIDMKYEAFTDLAKESTSSYNYQLQVYQTKAKALQDRYDLLQQKIKMGTISSDEATKEENSINAEAEDLKKMESNITSLENNAMQKNAIITQDITTYFKQYSRDKGIDYILGYGSSSNVLYANDSLDVTKDVLEALNANYRLNKAQKPKK